MLRLLLISLIPAALAAAESTGPAIAGIRVEFIIFGLTLVGVAVFHKRTTEVALGGLAAILAVKLGAGSFGPWPGSDHVIAGMAGLGHHLAHEWVTLANLTCLLLGFAVLAKHFEESNLPLALPRYLPGGWFGGWLLLVLVFVLSCFLDNIAAAMIGGTIAMVVFHRKVHIGYLAGIVAAANAGGAGSVVGDTTTTMMWLKGVHPQQVMHAFIGAGVVLLVLIISARQQHALQPLTVDPAAERTRVDWGRIGIVGLILGFAIGANVVANACFPAWGVADWGDRFPWIGVAVWLAILLGSPLRPPHWSLVRASIKGTVFLISLVLCASLMPVSDLPRPSWVTTLGMGFLSSVFDNIPLTALAIQQGVQPWGPGGGYDWGFLAYAVGFGGSMVWFGSSAGVALSNEFPEARSVGLWLRRGWYLPLAYVLGFAVMLATIGWQPEPIHAQTHDAAVIVPPPASSN